MRREVGRNGVQSLGSRELGIGGGGLETGENGEEAKRNKMTRTWRKMGDKD